MIFLIIGFSLLQAKISRLCGGGRPKLPLGLDQHLNSIPFGLAGFFLGSNLLESVIMCLVSYLFALLGKRLGHGQYYDLATFKDRIISPEKIDFIVRLFYGVDPLTKKVGAQTSYERDFFGLSLTGLVCSLGIAGCTILSGLYWWTIILVLTNTAKGLCYHLCLKYENEARWIMSNIFFIKFDDPKGHTEPSEYLTGFIQGLSIYGLLFSIIF
jgi:hypothetical protein